MSEPKSCPYCEHCQQLEEQEIAAQQAEAEAEEEARQQQAAYEAEQMYRQSDGSEGP